MEGNYDCSYIMDDFPENISTVEDLNKILLFSYERNISDIFIRVDDHIWASVYNDKRRVSHRKIKSGEVTTLINIINGGHSVDYIADKNAIDRSHEFTVRDNLKKQRYRFRINACGFLINGKDGIIITIRGIPIDVPRIDQLDVEDDIIRVATQSKSGMMLVCGATGQGKSTLLAAIMAEILERESSNANIITIESPIEFVYDKVNSPTSFITQQEVGKNLKSFHMGVENALRMAPDIILIGEMRNYETISAGVDASVTGHMVYSTLHASSTHETMNRMINQYPSALRDEGRIMLSDSIKMIVVQKLVKTVDNKRTALRSYLEFTPEVKEIISNTPNDLITKKIRELTEERGQTMYQCAKRKYEAGLIDESVLKSQG